MSNSILLLTKDALCKEYLPIYGNKYWAGKTPNIDELVAKGTVFNRHYTAAPSTVMAFRSMVTGLFAHEQPYSKYLPKEVESKPTDLFEMAKGLGYEGHLIWDETWVQMVLRFGNCYGKDTIIHNMAEIKQGVGCHYNHNGCIYPDDAKLSNTINRIVQEVCKILEISPKAFVWIHLPHVLNGRTAYGSDIDAFDSFVGEMRHLFDDENIFISADHGNMNGYKGKWCYGFDVNTPAIEIPLISPRIDNVCVCNDLTSNVDIKTLIFERRITSRKYVFSDCAYYAQPHRKLAIVNNDFAYIYNKADDSEELYDLKYDRFERVNLLRTNGFDVDRKLTSPIREYYYSPHWDNVEEIASEFRSIKNNIWRVGTWKEEFKAKYIRRFKTIAVRILMRLNILKKIHE
jgi:hypothetical protein